MMSVIRLSERLKACVDCITRGNITADIGCDHAYTSIYMVKNDIAPYVYASDINEGPVIRARQNVSESGCSDRISVIKADGMTGIAPEQNIQSVLICGMGGNLMIDILDNEMIKEHKFKELVLQPQSDIFKVRYFLHENGYKIIYEKMIYEDGKYYNVIKAVSGDQSFSNEYEYIYGSYLIHNSDPVLKSYLLDRRTTVRQILCSLKELPVHTDNQLAGIDSMEKELAMIEEVFDRCYK